MNKSALTADQIHFYHENGYLVVENVISAEQCDRAIAMYEKYAKPDYRGIMNLYRGFVEYTEVNEGSSARCDVALGSFIRTLLLGRAGPGWRFRHSFDYRLEVTERVEVEQEDVGFELSLVKHSAIVDMLFILQNAEVGLLQTMLLFKKAGSSYASQSWNPHQDNAYPQSPWGMYITGNIPFTDQDPENGCMRIYPKSHVEPILPFDAKKSFHENPGERPGHCVDVPPQYTATDLPMKKGSVLFLHGNVIHDSYPNRSKNRSRQMLLIPYITKGADFIPGKTAKRTFSPLR